MQIELINGYYIEIDPLNFTLKQKYFGTDKEGNLKDKETIRTWGYFSKFEDAVDKFLRLNQIEVMADMGMGMRDFVKKVEESNKEAVQAIKSVWDKLNNLECVEDDLK